jgi:hypothetical protein
MWLNLAAAAGESDAANERDELEKQMTPSQIADAEKLAREEAHYLKRGTDEDPLIQKYFGKQQQKATPETAR